MVGVSVSYHDIVHRLVADSFYPWQGAGISSLGVHARVDHYADAPDAEVAAVGAYFLGAAHPCKFNGHGILVV
jgi:hypothetical protein